MSKTGYLFLFAQNAFFPCNFLVKIASQAVGFVPKGGGKRQKVTTLSKKNDKG